MSIIFGYDSFKEGSPLKQPNCFLNDYENNISAINLLWGGYDENKNVMFYSHYNTLKDKIDIALKNTKDINEPYFYVIDVKPHEFWVNEKAKDINLHNKVLKDIKSGLCKILVLFIQECYKLDYGEADEIFNSWGEKYNLPEKSIIFISGNYNTPINNKYSIYLPYSSWEGDVRKYYDENKHTYRLKEKIIQKTNREKLFLCYNRRIRLNRKKLLFELFKNNLVDDGLISFSNEDIEGFPLELQNMLPLTIGNVDLDINQAETILFEDFEKTYLSIVTETEFYEGNVFPSEKIFKPIVSYHPFFVVSSSGFLKMLKGMGYKTFSKWFDESYDECTNLSKRIEIICKELKRLSKMKKQELNTMLLDMIDILDHNYKNFIDKTTNYKLEKQLKRLLL